MSNNDQPMFKMLFRDELFTLADVEKAAMKNPDILWVVYEVKRGAKGIQQRENLGTMSCATILNKYG